jgi:hypothetical protein
MDQIAGERSQAAIFAAEGKARHRLVRVAGATGVALLASWLIALALGVLGGFGSLPGLPGARSSESNAPSSQIQPAQRSHVSHSHAADPREGRAVHSARTSTPPPASHVPNPGQTQNSTPKTTLKVRISPSAPAPTESNSNNGRRLGTTKTKTTPPGKPLGSPGNGPGGSGAPGQLR